MKSLVLAEKPSVARDLARVLGSTQTKKGYIEGPKYVVTWALGHLVELQTPEDYDNQYKTWRLEDLPIMPEKMKLKVIRKVSSQFRTVSDLAKRKDIGELIIATDAGREGELVARRISRGYLGRSVFPWRLGMICPIGRPDRFPKIRNSRSTRSTSTRTSPTVKRA